MFDTHALFEDEHVDDDGPHIVDPADARLNNEVRASMSKIRDAELSGDANDVRKS